MPTATIASTVRTLVDQGKTNDQIFRTLRRKFGLDDNKRHYPQAYRRQYEQTKGRRSAA